MSADILRMLYDNDARLRQTETKEVPRINYGSAFPSSWPNNVPFFRTDLGWWAYYDGTRWLSAHEMAHPIKVNDASAPVTYAAAGNTITCQSTHRGDYDIYVTRVSAVTTVAVTNDGTNNWTITLRDALAGASAVTVHSFSTSADVAGTAATHDAAPSGTAALSGKNMFDIVVTKNSAPGALTINGLTVYYRMIMT